MTHRKLHHLSEQMDGWMDGLAMSFLTAFQSYQGDGSMIMKGCVQWNPIYGWKSKYKSFYFRKEPNIIT